MNRFLSLLIASVCFYSVLASAMQPPAEPKKVPSELLKGCGAVASKSYTCRAFTPEEEAELNAKNKLNKIYQVREAVGDEAFATMTEDEVYALYDKACYKAAEKIVNDGGCILQ